METNEIVLYWEKRVTEDISAARELLTDGLYCPAVSRLGYAVYHMMCMVQEHLHCDITVFYDHSLEPHFSESLRGIMDEALRYKHDVDHKAFFQIEKKEVQHLLDNVEFFVKEMRIRIPKFTV